jgi:hypothetical protein
MVVMEKADDTVEGKEGPEVRGKKFVLAEEDKTYRWKSFEIVVNCINM